MFCVNTEAFAIFFDCLSIPSLTFLVYSQGLFPIMKYSIDIQHAWNFIKKLSPDLRAAFIDNINYKEQILSQELYSELIQDALYIGVISSAKRIIKEAGKHFQLDTTLGDSFITYYSKFESRYSNPATPLYQCINYFKDLGVIFSKKKLLVALDIYIKDKNKNLVNFGKFWNVLTADERQYLLKKRDKALNLILTLKK